MSTKTFDELYCDVPARQREQLREFRRTHPYQHLQVGDVTWEYIASGEGPAAILLLGGGISVGETAFRNILRLEKRFRVLSPTYPAVGKMSAIASGLAAILDHERIPAAHVSGHSLGSAVGHVFVRLCPERVDKLALDAFGLYTSAHTRLAKLFFKLPYPLLLAYYRRAFKRLMAGADEGQQAFMQAYVEELFTKIHTRQSYMGQFNLLLDIFDHYEEYGIFRPVERPGRVLLTLAEDDRGFSPAEREALIRTYPGATVHKFASGGHLTSLTHSDEFDALLDRFLDQNQTK